MIPLFGDAAYWIALINPEDRLHAKALSLSRLLHGRKIVTSQIVLAEFLSWHAFSKLKRLAAVEMVNALFNNKSFEIVPQSDELFRAALSLYSSRSDKKWGMADCSSFCIMQKRGIQEALTYDVHFEQAGFRALMR